MVRIRLLASCLAGPSGIIFRGHEIEADERKASLLVATGQWEQVAPPVATVSDDEGPETGEWTGEPVKHSHERAPASLTPGRRCKGGQNPNPTACDIANRPQPPSGGGVRK